MSDVETVNPNSVCTAHDPWVKMVWTGQPFGWWCPKCRAYVCYIDLIPDRTQ